MPERLLTKQPALRRLRHLCSACRSPGARPWTLAACGDLGRRPALPNPQGAFSPRKGGFAHPFHPHSQGRHSPLPLHPLAACPAGTKEGTSPLWTLHGKDHSPSVPAPYLASATVNIGPKPTFANRSGCRGAARRTSHSLRLQNLNASDLTVCGQSEPSLRLRQWSLSGVYRYFDVAQWRGQTGSLMSVGTSELSDTSRH